MLITNILLGMIIFLLVIIFGGICNIDRNMISLKFRGSYGPIIRKVKHDKTKVD